MGNSLSGKPSVIESKIHTASKTGVLNISDQSLKPNSVCWVCLADQKFVTSLKVLDISKNKIKALPTEIRGLSKLKTFQCSSCSLSRTYDLVCLEYLTTLDLSYNSLEIDCLGQLPTSLTKVSLAHNRFSAVPFHLLTVSSITELDLSGNRIQACTGIGSLTSLITLNLDDNVIFEICASDVEKLIKLRHLSLKNNKIGPTGLSHSGKQSLCSALFTNTSLDRLDLQGNTATLTSSVVLSFEGVDKFMDRRKKIKDRGVSGGALVDFELFGLP